MTERPLTYERDGFYFIGIRYSLHNKARFLGATWCVYERMLKIPVGHPNAAILLSMAGYHSIESIETGNSPENVIYGREDRSA